MVYQDGPKTLRETSSTTEQLSGDECTEAISMMKHSTDAPVIKDKMKTTFKYRQNLIHDPDKSSLILDYFPRFLDTPGLVRNIEILMLIVYVIVMFVIDMIYLCDRLTKTLLCFLEMTCQASLLLNGQHSTSQE